LPTGYDRESDLLKKLACFARRFGGHELSENFRVASYFKIKTYLTSRRVFSFSWQRQKKGGRAENDPKGTQLLSLLRV
jgi:hypothetical protein